VASPPTLNKPYGYGYRRAIDIEELFSLFPESVPSLNNPYHYSKDRMKELRQKMLTRFKDLPMKTDPMRKYNCEEDILREMEIKAVFLMSDAVNFEMNV
jgi:hypothetical protein